MDNNAFVFDVSYMRPVFVLDYIEPIIREQRHQHPIMMINHYVIPAFTLDNYGATETIYTIWDDGDTIWPEPDASITKWI